MTAVSAELEAALKATSSNLKNATAFSLIQVKNNVTKADVLPLLGAIIKNPCIPLIKFISTYRITINEANEVVWGNDFLYEVLRYRSIDELQWVLQDLKAEQMFFENLAKSGNMVALKEIDRKYPYPREYVTSEFIFNLAEIGLLATLKWMVERFELTREDLMANKNYILRAAASENHIYILQWLTTEYNLVKQDIMTNTNSPVYWSAVSGHLMILQWLVEKFHITREEILADNTFYPQTAAANGYINMLQWLVEKFKITREEILAKNNPTFHAAICNGHIEILDYLVEEFELTQSDIAINEMHAWAEKFGQTDAIAWLNREFPRNARANLQDNLGAMMDIVMAHTRSLSYCDKSAIVYVIIDKKIPVPSDKLRNLVDNTFMQGKFCTTYNSELIDVIIDIYELSEKPIGEIFRIVCRLCASGILCQVVDHLVGRGIICDAKNSPLH